MAIEKLKITYKRQK